MEISTIKVPSLGRGLIRAKVLLAWSAFVVYLLFTQDKSSSLWLLGWLVIYNLLYWLLSATWNRWHKRTVQYLLVILGVGLVLLALVTSSEGKLFYPLVLIEVISLAFYFGHRAGFAVAMVSWLAILAGELNQGASLVNLIKRPDSGITWGVAMALTGWVVGQLAENNHRLQQGIQDLSSLAKTDSLTGVYSRQYLQRFLRTELKKCQDSEQQLSVIRIALDHFQNLLDQHGDEVGKTVLAKTGEIIQENVRGKDRVGRFGEDEFCVVLPGADSFDALDVAEKIRIAVKEHFKGGQGESKIDNVTVSLGIATFPKDAEDKLNLIYRANQTLYRARHSKRDRVCLSSITIDEVQRKIKRAGSALAENIPTLVAIIDAKDVNTCGHSERVTKYSVAIAKAMGITGEELSNIQYGALLHDIGKINVEEHILDKPGRLSEHELYSIRNHPNFGANFLSTIDYLKKVTPLVLYHHERWDGNGYPEGIKGENIPLGARIIAVADAFDAMTSDRPYKKSFLVEEAVKELTRCRGTQFDPAVVDAFIKLVDCNTGEILF